MAAPHAGADDAGQAAVINSDAEITAGNMGEFALVHYSEIYLKGGNRGRFERMLASNVAKALGDSASRAVAADGRIIAKLAENADLEKAGRRLSLIPGIANFSFAESAPLEMDVIRKAALALVKKSDSPTFKVFTSRSNKRFPLDSHGVDCALGDAVVESLGKKVDVHKPGLILHVEICEKNAFLYADRRAGAGGLPVGSSGRLVCSLSGGLDSPVAAFMMMKRGCEVTFAHAHNSTIGSTGVKGKLERIVSALTEAQLTSKLYIVPFEKLQRQVIACVPSPMRMILYRRAMMRVMNGVAKLERCKGVVTGDSVGQVASQTLENLDCIYRASELPVFAPLAGMNKSETVDIARRIGTYEASIVQSPDCCSFMIAKHPETRARPREIEALEANIPVRELAEEAVAKSEILEFEAK